MPTPGPRPLTLFAARRAAAARGRVVLVVGFWRRHAHEVIDREVVDRRRRRKLHAYVDLLADAAHGRRWTGSVVLTHAATADALGCCERTVSYLRAVLDDLGLLTTAEEGTTPSWREASGSGITGNRAPVYVLTRVVEAVTHKVDDEIVEGLETRCGSRGVESSCTPLLGLPRRDERTAAAPVDDPIAWACAAAGVSARWLRRQVEAAGLGGSDGLDDREVAHALRHHPDGSRWSFGWAGTRRPVGAVRWMLRAWASFVVGGDVDSLRAHMPTVLDAADAALRWEAAVVERDRLRAAQAARRAADAADRAAAAPVDAPGRVEVLALRDARRAARQSVTRRSA